MAQTSLAAEGDNRANKPEPSIFVVCETADNMHRLGNYAVNGNRRSNARSCGSRLNGNREGRTAGTACGRLPKLAQKLSLNPPLRKRADNAVCLQMVCLLE